VRGMRSLRTTNGRIVAVARNADRLLLLQTAVPPPPSPVASAPSRLVPRAARR
jgi:hypothetical protein